MRVELRDGQWAELRERISHGQNKVIRRASLATEVDEGGILDWQTILTRTFVKAWNVLDPDGAPIPIEDPDAIDRAPDDIIEILFDKSSQIYVGATVPNSPTPASSDDSS